MMEGIDLDSLKEKNGLVNDLGIEYVETEPEKVVMKMPVDERQRDEDGKPVCVSRCRWAVVDAEG